MEYSVIIPAYNEQEAIRPLYYSLRKVMEELGKLYEIIFINDGSTDCTYDILKSLSCDKDNLIVINLIKNQGQSEAFQKGFNNAKGKIIITLDSDLQNDPRDIPMLLKKLREGYDVVCGWRKNRGDRFLKKLLSKAANLLRRIFLGEKIHDVSCSLRVYKSESLKNINLSSQMYYMLTAILSSSGYKLGEIEIRDYPRRFGKSKFNIITKLSSGLLIFKYLVNRSKYIRIR